jgi:hypothetical protein
LELCALIPRAGVEINNKAVRLLLAPWVRALLGPGAVALAGFNQLVRFLT